MIAGALWLAYEPGASRRLALHGIEAQKFRSLQPAGGPEMKQVGCAQADEFCLRLSNPL